MNCSLNSMGHTDKGHEIRNRKGWNSSIQYPKWIIKKNCDVPYNSPFHINSKVKPDLNNFLPVLTSIENEPPNEGKNRLTKTINYSNYYNNNTVSNPITIRQNSPPPYVNSITHISDNPITSNPSNTNNRVSHQPQNLLQSGPCIIHYGNNLFEEGYVHVKMKCKTSANKVSFPSTPLVPVTPDKRGSEIVNKLFTPLKYNDDKPVNYTNKFEAEYISLDEAISMWRGTI